MRANLIDKMLVHKYKKLLGDIQIYNTLANSGTPAITQQYLDNCPEMFAVLALIYDALKVDTIGQFIDVAARQLEEWEYNLDQHPADRERINVTGTDSSSTD